MVGITGLEWVRSYFAMPYQPLAFTVASAVLIPLAVFRIYQLRDRFRALRLGRDGERSVAEKLHQLRRDGAVVFHDLQGDGFNVDHLILSRRGIFAVETKTYSKRSGDKVWFDGKTLKVDGLRLDRDPVEQVRATARWVASTIRDSTGKPFGVRPVLVFPGWFVNPVKEHGNSDVWVLNADALPTFVRNEPERLSEEDFRLAVFHVARIARTV